MSWQRSRYALRKQLKQALKALIPAAIWNRLRPAPPAGAAFTGRIDPALLLDWQAARRNSSAAIRPDLPPGVNLVGYLSAAIGLGEAARGMLRGLRASDLPISLVDFSHGVPREQRGLPLPADLPRGFLHQVNLIHLNPNHLSDLWAQSGPAGLLGRYNVGIWLWELPHLPAEWLPALPLFDEFWAPSRFIQAALQEHAAVPVHLVPPVVEAPYEAALTRADFNLPEAKYLFLLVYDVNSLVERKNPLGAVEAFRRAFPADQDQARLVIKVNNGASNPAAMRRLRAAVAGLSVTLIQEILPTPKMNALIRVCDCVLSLHRSEGYGLVGAQALLLRRRVIATAWSGSLDWMDDPLVSPIGFRLIPVPGMPGQVWADPHLDEAARVMRGLVSR